MPVPTLISQLSTTPGSNSPAGSDAPGVIDDHLRTVYAFIKTLSDEKLPTADGSVTTAKIANSAVTPAKLANGGAELGTRNKIINGAFQINQRAYASGAATVAGQYTLDRWKTSGTGGVTFSTTANKTTVTIPASRTIQQVIEGLNLQTGTYVLSWEGTAQGRIGAGGYGASGAVTASITGGTNTTIEFNTGTVTNVQLELGTVATPFDDRPIGQELDLCRRYARKFNSGVFGSAASAVSFVASIPLSPPMRATPTASTPNAALTITDFVADYVQSSANVGTLTGQPDGVQLAFNNFAGLTAFRPYNINGGAFFILSAEL